MKVEKIMIKGNIRDIMPDEVMRKYFEGKVEIRKIVTEATSKEAEVYQVTFFHGARTKLHYHETDQILLATKGWGMVAAQTSVIMESDNIARVKMDEVYTLVEGDYVCVPAFAWHWHGAQTEKDFVHIQMKKPGKTTWFE